MNPPPLILASSSVYRRELLSRLGLPFTVVSPGVEEPHLEGEAPGQRALRLAAAKAEAVALRHPDAVVIGSDQVATAAGAILDKPGTEAAAREQLRWLSGREAAFHTAVAVRRHGTQLRLDHVDTVTVAFRALTAAAIAAYVAREQPFDCAGAFKSEGAGIALLSALQSHDPTALIGLPLIWLAGALRQAGYSLF